MESLLSAKSSCGDIKNGVGMIQAKKIIVFSAVLLITGGLSACDKSDGNAQNSAGNDQPSRGINKPVVSNNRETYLITASGIGPIKLGATLDEARKSFPTATFERSPGGEGVAKVDVKLGQENLMTLFAGEQDSEAPIDWSNKIVSIETVSEFCKMENGIHPGSAVLDVEQILGKTKQIILSEGDSLEYIFFVKQPKYVVFRLDLSAIFEDGSRETNKFNPKAKVEWIAVEDSN